MHIRFQQTMMQLHLVSTWRSSEEVVLYSGSTAEEI